MRLLDWWRNRWDRRLSLVAAEQGETRHRLLQQLNAYNERIVELQRTLETTNQRVMMLLECDSAPALIRGNGAVPPGAIPDPYGSAAQGGFASTKSAASPRAGSKSRDKGNRK